jgi:hypothetical protein
MFQADPRKQDEALMYDGHPSQGGRRVSRRKLLVPRDSRPSGAHARGDRGAPSIHHIAQITRPRRSQRGRGLTKCPCFVPASPWPCNCLRALTRASERVHVRNRPRGSLWMPRRNRRTLLRPEQRHGGSEPRCRDTLRREPALTAQATTRTAPLPADSRTRELLHTSRVRVPLDAR